MQTLRTLARFVRLAWEARPLYLAGTVAVRIGRSIMPLITLWLAKLIIDEVIALAAGDGSQQRLWQFVALEMLAVAILELLARASALIDNLLGERFAAHISIRIMEQAARLNLAQFEDSSFQDHLERARQGTIDRVALLIQLLGMAQSALTLGFLSVALAAHAPWLLMLLLAAAVPAFVAETHFASRSYNLFVRWTPLRRQLDYVRYLGASPETAKEVQLFGLAPWLLDRYRGLSRRFADENRSLAVRKTAFSAGLSLVGTLAYYAAYVSILSSAVAGAISVGTLTFLAASFRQNRDLLQPLLLSLSAIYEQSLSLLDLFAYLDMRPTMTSPPNARPLRHSIRSGFVFENVGFRHQGSEHWAVRHLNLEIGPHERVALVGENGAGKTTVTKLMARLYDPAEGRILLDGTDLRDYEMADLRRAIGVIFQDFVRYDMRLDENVGIGEVESVRYYLDAPGSASQPHAPPSITSAVERALATPLVCRLPGAYRQMLGRRFEGGVNLSGGEWQKVALARAYMRDAQVMILDEPTAALDARAEYEVFERFHDLMKGRMAIVISHRFSTVRMVDRIIVLRNGRLVQQGTHKALAHTEGLYGELFAIQAAGYRD